MKNKNRFSSYAEALKRLNLLEGQETLTEATKYVLKQNKPQTEAPAPEPSLEAPSEPMTNEPAPPPPPVENPADEEEDTPIAEAFDEYDMRKRQYYAGIHK